jgi:hypothetical protein
MSPAAKLPLPRNKLAWIVSNLNGARHRPSKIDVMRHQEVIHAERRDAIVQQRSKRGKAAHLLDGARKLANLHECISGRLGGHD